MFEGQKGDKTIHLERLDTVGRTGGLEHEYGSELETCNVEKPPSILPMLSSCAFFAGVWAV